MSPAQWNRLIDRLFDLAAPYLAVRGDMDHARVSHQYARLLLRREGGDPKVVEPAVILHDVGWSALEPDQIRAAYGVRPSGEEANRLNRTHEVAGAVIAGEILESIDYDRSLTEAIVTIIERHDSGDDPAGLEEKLVKDADRLWRFSKIGLWQELEKQGGIGPREYHDFVGARIETWFYTPTAADLAREEWARRAVEIARRGALT
ncbi:MAG: HD domain-containing protein [Proteobacteria bacterium]|nr:HD domain-containing protein [Pseudomonadota bacterium]